MARALKRRSSVEGLVRLKIVVLLTYATTALVSKIVDVPRLLNADALMFLYAVRESAYDDAKHSQTSVVGDRAEAW